MFGNKNSYLGVDLGSASIKVVELANFKGRPRLMTYGFTEKSPGDIAAGGLITDVEEAAALLKEICAKSKTLSKKAITALPNFAVFSSILTLPAMNKKELASAISWEAKKIIPLPLEEIVLDWKIIEEGDGLAAPAVPVANGEKPAEVAVENLELKKIFAKPHKNMRILLTGASKNLIRKYIDIFNKAGLSLLSLETESFALIRSLIGNDKSVIMLIDIGASTSSIIMVDRGVPALTRSIEMGGLTLTKAVSASLNVNLERAEQFKQDLTLDGETAENSLPQTVEKSLGPILNEIKYTLNLYQETNGKKVEKIILTGGGSLLGHLTGYLSRTLNLNTYIGDPWARTIYPTDLKPILDRLGSRFAVAVGLAMREIE